MPQGQRQTAAFDRHTNAPSAPYPRPSRGKTALGPPISHFHCGKCHLGPPISHFHRGKCHLGRPSAHFHRGKGHLGPPIAHFQSGQPDLGRRGASLQLGKCHLGSPSGHFQSGHRHLGGSGNDFHVRRPVPAGTTCCQRRLSVWVGTPCRFLRRCSRNDGWRLHRSTRIAEHGRAGRAA